MNDDDDMDEATRSTLKRRAEERCDHEEQWVSRTEDGLTAEACWSCLLDAYFDHRLGRTMDTPTTEQ